MSSKQLDYLRSFEKKESKRVVNPVHIDSMEYLCSRDDGGGLWPRPDWRRKADTELGSGQFGTVYPVCRGPGNEDCNYVAKFVHFEREHKLGEELLLTVTPEKFEREVLMQKLCSQKLPSITSGGREEKLLPTPPCIPVVDSWICGRGGTKGRGGVIVMPTLRVTLQNLLLNTINNEKLVDLEKDRRSALVYMFVDTFYAINDLHKYGLAHGDLKPDNIMASFGELRSMSPEEAGKLSYLDKYLLSHFVWKVIDFGKTIPLPSASLNPEERQEEIKHDYDIFINDTNNLLEDYSSVFVGDEVIDVLYPLFEAIRYAIDNGYSKDEAIKLIRDETTWFDDDLAPQE